MADEYLIWSNEHAAWWRPSRAGYTVLASEAGRYTLAEAREICGPFPWSKDYAPPDEVIVQGFPEQQLDVEVEALRDQLAEMKEIAVGLLAKNSQLLDALAGLWSYAATGAAVSDVYTADQPQFVKARKLLVESGKWKQ